MHEYIQPMSSNLEVFHSLFKGLSREELHWRPAPDKWNLLEILCHLYDEEREDFRPRLRSVLLDPEQAFLPIDPAGWVASRRYAEQDADAMLQAFVTERKGSLEWLRTLSDAHWENTYQHPQIGPMSAKFILANWVAHDLLHIRQIVKLKYEHLKHRSGESTDYAGEW